MLVLHILNFFYGYYKIRVDKDQAVKIINLMMKCNINYWGLKYDNKGDLIFKILLNEYKKLHNILDKNRCIVYIVYEKGLPYYIKRYRRRIGIVVGALIFTCILWLSTLFIWDIEINGNYSTKDEIILERLGSLGCEIGSFIPSINLEKLCNSYILNYDDASWITVNLIGTVAKVEMRERIKPENGIDNKPANIIAKSDGFIDSYQIFAGNGMIDVATIVKKGDLLISGIVELPTGEIQFLRADGLINAVTNKSFTVNVPLDFTKKTFTGVSDTKKSIKMFRKNINFYINDGTFIEKYDRIIDVNRIILFGLIKLPITVTTVTYNEYEYTPWQLNEDEAKLIAEKQMADLLYKELKDVDVLETTTTSGIINNEYVITCDIRCMENIAEPSLIITN